MVLGVSCVFLGIFLNWCLKHFSFSVAWSPFLGLFWPEEGRFLTFFPERNAAGMLQKRKCFRHQLKKMPQKTQLTPKTIFMSIFIFCRTNVRDIYHFYVCLNCVEFNTFFTFTLIAATHLSNQDYNICFRRTIKACNICYSVNIAGSGSTGAQGSFGLRYGLWTYTDFAM